MAVTIKKHETMEAVASGYLIKITKDGFVIEDEKTGEMTLEFKELKPFLGEKVKISISNKKTNFVDDVVDE